MGELEGTYIKDRDFKNSLIKTGENKSQFFERVSTFFEKLLNKITKLLIKTKDKNKHKR